MGEGGGSIKVIQDEIKRVHENLVDQNHEPSL